MKKVAQFLQENPVQYLATVSLDGKAKCRPFMFSFEKDGKLWFNTGNFKEVYKELQANPYVQISVSSPTYQWIRLSLWTIRPSKRLRWRIPLSREIIRPLTTRPLKCSIWKILMA